MIKHNKINIVFHDSIIKSFFDNLQLIELRVIDISDIRGFG